MKPPALHTRAVSNQYSLVGRLQCKALVSKKHWFPKTDTEAILSTGIHRNYLPKKVHRVGRYATKPKACTADSCVRWAAWTQAMACSADSGSASCQSDCSSIRFRADVPKKEYMTGTRTRTISVVAAKPKTSDVAIGTKN